MVWVSSVLTGTYTLSPFRCNGAHFLPRSESFLAKEDSSVLAFAKNVAKWAPVTHPDARNSSRCEKSVFPM
ncbi:hypothetical protein JTE90_010591 [Oedothorax gibbosus]|uniref:Secreted protein n=1 Tax=Oedothorax gibbosus TaxID=931172 RepID=A0AAV6V4H8_9ARAC|nr:hypothetical protein JTE90_010591 [Oedothorax gibbosus]